MSAPGLDVKPPATVSESHARRLRRLAVALSVAAFGAALGILAIGTSGDAPFELELTLVTVGFLGIIVLAPLVGALILQRRPHTRVAWLMIVVGLSIGLGLLTAAYGGVGMPGPSSPSQVALPLALEALVISALFFIPALGMATTFILLLFPTDRLLGRRWQAVVAIALVGGVLYEITTLFRRGSLDPNDPQGPVNPLAAPVDLAPVLDFLSLASGVLLVLGFTLAVVSLVVRYRRAESMEAAQIRWLVLIALVAVPANTIAGLNVGPISQLASELGVVFLACMPIAIGIAITRYRLYEIDRLINRTIVYGALTAILAGVFAAGAGLSQRVFLVVTGDTSDAAIVAATLIVATVYTPLKKWLDSLVDRRFKYEQARFGSYREELERTLSLIDVEAAADRLAREIARETGATDVAVVGASGEPTALIGRWPVPDPTTIPIPGGGPQLNTLVLSISPKHRALDDRGRSDIESIAGLAARAVRRSEGR